MTNCDTGGNGRVLAVFGLSWQASHRQRLVSLCLHDFGTIALGDIPLARDVRGQRLRSGELASIPWISLGDFIQLCHAVVGDREARGKARALDPVESDHARNAMNFRAMNLKSAGCSPLAESLGLIPV